MRANEKTEMCFALKKTTKTGISELLYHYGNGRKHVVKSIQEKKKKKKKS